MKKNITINMFGILYAIDEDAYELLEKYQNSIRTYFSKQEGGEEIIDDIEHRVAELFAELRSKGIEAITIEHVEDIIGRIGNPEQMEEGTGEDSEETKREKKTSSAQTVRKKLYRDTTDQMLGGVMSGLSHYFGGDPLAWRLLLILLCFLTSFLLLFVYIAAWILIPSAKTPQDVLRMKGKEVTPENIAQVVMNNDHTMHREGFNKVLEILMIMLKIMLFVLYGVCLLMFIIGVIACVVIIVLAISGEFTSGQWYYYILPYNAVSTYINNFTTVTEIYFWILMVSGFVCCAIPLYCIGHYFLSYRKSVKPMSISQRLIWFVTWVISVIIIISSGILLSISLNKNVDSCYESSVTTMHYNVIWDKYINQCCLCSDDSKDNSNSAVKGVVMNSNTPFYQCVYSYPRAKAGVYRLTVRALSDNNQCYAFISYKDKKFFNTIAQGTPGEGVIIAQNGTDSTLNESTHVDIYQLKANPLLALKECVVDSVVIRKDVDLKYGIETSSFITGEKMKGSYLAFANDMLLERIGDLPQKFLKKDKVREHR